MSATSSNARGEAFGLPRWDGTGSIERAYAAWPSPHRDQPAGPAETVRPTARPTISIGHDNDLALKAARARALTDPLGAKGQRTGSARRMRREWHARRTLFCASVAAFTACFGVIVRSSHAQSEQPVDDPVPAAAMIATVTPTATATARATAAATVTGSALDGVRTGFDDSAPSSQSAVNTAPTDTATAEATDTPTPEPTATATPVRGHTRTRSS